MPQRAKLSNGLNILTIEKSELPVVAFGLLLRAGGITDPADKPGLAHLTASMLLEGTTNRTTLQIAEDIEFLGAHLSSQANREYAMLSVETLTSHFATALDIMADVVQNPTFPVKELERVRRERLIDFQRISDNPVAIASRAFRALTYGQGTKYGHPANGNEQSIQNMTRDDLTAQFAGHYRPEDSTLIVVGDVSQSEIISKAEALFGSWSANGTSVAADADSAPPDAPSTTIYIADKPGAAQSIIRAGHLTIPRHHADYYVLALLNYMFGGNFSARLNANLRQDKGYSYGYNSTIDWFTGPSVLAAGGGVQTDVTKEAVVETLKEFADIRENRPVNIEEFNNARDGIFRGLPAQFETQGQALGQLTRMVSFGLPDDYFSQYVANVEAVTLDDIHRVAREQIDDSRLRILVVGDRETIEPGLQELGLPIVNVDYEGQVLS